MKISEIPFNMKYSIADDLREMPDDAEQMRRGLNYLKDQLKEAKEGDVSTVLMKSQVGSYARIIGDLDLSDLMLNEAYQSLSKMGKSAQAFAINLRLGINDYFRKNYSKADKLFFEAIKECKKNKELYKYLDFALQHYAKSKFEQGLYESSLDLFLEAFELRLIKGDLELIQSTEHGIAIVRKKLNNKNL